MKMVAQNHFKYESLRNPFSTQFIIVYYLLDSEQTEPDTSYFGSKIG